MDYRTRQEAQKHINQAQLAIDTAALRERRRKQEEDEERREKDRIQIFLSTTAKLAKELKAQDPNLSELQALEQAESTVWRDYPILRSGADFTREAFAVRQQELRQENVSYAAHGAISRDLVHNTATVPPPPEPVISMSREERQEKFSEMLNLAMDSSIPDDLKRLEAAEAEVHKAFPNLLANTAYTRNEHTELAAKFEARKKAQAEIENDVNASDEKFVQLSVEEGDFQRYVHRGLFGEAKLIPSKHVNINIRE